MFYCSALFAQDTESMAVPGKVKNMRINGYISELYVPVYTFDDSNLQHIGLLHNRLNLKLTPSSCWDISAELRTRAMFQDFRGYTSEQFKALTQDPSRLNLSRNPATGNYALITASIERLYAAYQTDNFSVKIGRQRINWSQALIFNPNDIFNGYSFFDFDYPERQGSDAIRISSYPTGTSVVELAAKLNRNGELTLAGLYRLNVKEWDIQILGGLVNNDDLMLGTGFSGDIKGVNMRGEFSSYRSISETSELKNTFLASLGVDYLFKNSLFLSVSGMYNRLSDNYSSNLTDLLNAPMSPKYLSITEWTACVQLSYPFTPLLNGSFMLMSFIDSPIFYFGPSIDFSVLNNLALSAMIQSFTDCSNTAPSNMILGYFRLKYNF